MPDLLFVTWDGGGNVPPLLALAARLHARGHIVRVMGHPQQADAVAAAGVGFVPFTRASAFSSTEPSSPLRLAGLFGDRMMGRDVSAELQARPADLVVVDCLLFGAMDALRRGGTPYVVLEHLFDGYLRGPWTRGPMGLAMRARRLPPRAFVPSPPPRCSTPPNGAWSRRCRTSIPSPARRATGCTPVRSSPPSTRRPRAPRCFSA
jgi:UDP:flavonoid glycosyltransferase YjiC (YdhE family)